jgi:hypothetical protein
VNAFFDTVTCLQFVHSACNKDCINVSFVAESPTQDSIALNLASRQCNKNASQMICQEMINFQPNASVANPTI